MSDFDSSLPVRGPVTDGAAVDTFLQLFPVMGSDGSNYQAVMVDSAGNLQVEITDGTNTASIKDGTNDSVRVTITDTTDDLDIVIINSAFGATPGVLPIAAKYEATRTTYDDGDAVPVAVDAEGRPIIVGQVADGSVVDSTAYPVLIAGQDGTNIQTVKTNTEGQIQVEVVSGIGSAEIYDYATTNLVKDTPTTVNSYTPSSGTDYITQIIIAGSGLLKADIQWGVTAAEVTKIVAFNSTANPTIDIRLAESVDLASTDTILVSCTNLENSASPASDFDGYVTIIGHD